MSRATEDLFDALHALTVESISEEIKAYRVRGEAIPPALLAQAIKLLKDNGIDSPARAEKVRDTLAAEMPDFTEHDMAGPGVPH